MTEHRTSNPKCAHYDPDGCVSMYDHGLPVAQGCPYCKIERLSAELFKADLERAAAGHYGRELAAERDRLNREAEQHMLQAMKNGAEAQRLRAALERIARATGISDAAVLREITREALAGAADTSTVQRLPEGGGDSRSTDHAKAGADLARQSGPSGVDPPEGRLVNCPDYNRRKEDD